ncbi:MAG: hypothetical protein J07HQW1_00028, partial [Haloquadratum walsbyi J07HQW1]
ERYVRVTLLRVATLCGVMLILAVLSHTIECFTS